MPDFGSPVSGGAWVGQNGADICVPSATMHTKGSWSDVTTLGRSGQIAFGLTWGQSYTSHRMMLIDLAIGAAGSEQVILSNLAIAFSAAGSSACRAHWQEIVLPLTLPEGSLLRARCQSSYGSNAGVYPVLSSSYNLPSAWTGNEITTYGADTANTAGTTLTAGAGNFAWGPYAQLTSSCNRMECFFVVVFPRVAQNAFSDQDGWWELAVGESGSEQIIASGNTEANLATQLNNPQWFGPYYQQVADGQRLSGRLMRQNTTSQRTLDMIVYGVR